MKIQDILKERKTGISLEFFPFYKLNDPEKEILVNEQNFIKTLIKLKQVNPLFVSVTCGAGGADKDTSQKNLERTFKTIKVIQENTDFTPMAHFTCVALDKDGTSKALQRYKDMGVRNILALRGDPPKGEKEFKPPENGFTSALELVEFIRKEFGDWFSIGVAVYPEGHPEAKNFTEEREYTKRKIGSGANFAITQLFLKNTYYLDLVEWANKENIQVPIIPGILTDYEPLEKLCGQTCVSIPEHLLKRLREVKKGSKEDMYKFSVEKAIEQCENLLMTFEAEVNFLHLYTMNRSKAVMEICKDLEIHLESKAKAERKPL